MPTLLSHPAVPLALGFALGSRVIKPRLLVVGIVFSILPDLDVLMLRLGFPYGDGFGHRGFSHSLSFALVLALLTAGFSHRLQTRFLWAFLFLFVTTASHGLLDCLTDGGHGIALWWPFSDERFFAPFQPIAVAPLGLGRFFSMRGVEVLTSELLWVWLPCAILTYLAIKRPFVLVKTGG